MAAGSICDVLPATAALFDVPGPTDPSGLLDDVRDVRQVSLVLVDGIGWHLLPELAPDAPLLASVLVGGAG